MNIIQLSFCVLLAGSFCWNGCELFASHTNPIAGWEVADYVGQPNEMIVKDYQDFIQTLPAKEKSLVDSASISYFKDATGQHAIKIEIPQNGIWWEYVLIYGKDNERIKTVKYTSGGYRS
jgi:hypothetical protein